MFSKGFHAKVYDITSKKEEDLWVARADLVREEDATASASLEARRLFYSHKIVRLLFPKNTIEVTGARPKGGSTLLYSKLAPIPSEHAVFSKHSEIHEGNQIFECGCEACAKHTLLHSKNEFQDKAEDIARKMNHAGIVVPLSDPTDYCISDAGDIIFFEHDFIIQKIEDFIRANSNQSIGDKLLRLLERYKKLDKEVLVNTQIHL